MAFARVAGCHRREHRASGLAEEIGEATVEVWRDIQILVSFVGELGVALAYAAIHPRSVRWRDALRVAEAVGSQRSADRGAGEFPDGI